MLVHSVFFWLKKELSETEREQFAAGIETLKGISCAEAVYIGTPAATADRPVMEKSYDFALTVIAKDVAAHDEYQADPIHQEFLTNFKVMFEKVVVYDAD